jgi:hypothetical protein
MAITTYKAIDGTEFPFDQNVTVKDCSQSGTIAQINISGFTARDKDILIIHFEHDISTSGTGWIVQMGMVSYYIVKQDGTLFADDISEGTYLTLIANSSDYAFYIIGAGGSGDAYPLTTEQMDALLALL